MRATNSLHKKGSGGVGVKQPLDAIVRGVAVRIVVDLNRCLGYAQCVPLAPAVLQLNGEEALVYDPNPDESQRQQVARAVASCPVQAIIAEMDPPSDRATL
jgi:ferredoxin